MQDQLTQEELIAFNKDLKEVCEKHNVTLSIGQQIIVNKVLPAPTTGSSEDTETKKKK